MSNTFRKQYRPLTDFEKDTVSDIKSYAEAMERIFNQVRVGVAPVADSARAIALAQTKLEEAVMWAVKAVTG